MKKFFLSTISLVLVFSLATPPVLAQDLDGSNPAGTEPAEHVPGELLVRFSPGMNSAQVANKMKEMNVAHKREIQGIQVHLVKLSPSLSVEQAMDRFSHLPGVEFAEPNYILHIAETSHAEVIDQWGLTKIHTQEAWNTLSENQKNEVLLASVDTGIHKEESDLSSRIWTNPDETSDDGIDNDSNGYVDDTWGWDFVNNDKDPTDDHMHGTAVTSVMVAAQDGAGMVGICPWCRIVAVKVLDSQGSGSLDVVASGIVYATQNGARVINLSLAGAIGSQTLEAAVNFAWNQGAMVVAAAGNDGNNTTLYPAGYANAISVASTNSGDKHSCFSNYKDGYISVAAPGEAIYVIDINNSTTGYNYYSGTSLSTPHVTGLAGLILGKDPNLSNAQVRSIIENSAVDLGSPGGDAAFGFGRIDAYRAVIGDFSQITPPDSLSSASDTATGYAHSRKLVRDGTGRLHLIWHTNEGSLYRIRYATSVDNGDTWILQPDVFNSPYETYHPALAADDTYLYVAIPSRVNAGSPYQIFFTRKPLTGGTWSSPVSLMGGNYNAVRPDIYVDPTNGRLHLIASSLDDSPNLYYRASNAQGASWGNLSQFNPSNSTSDTRYASVYANGDNIYIATRTVSNLLFYTYYYLYTARSTNGGVTWTDQTQISWFLAFTSGEYGVSLAGVGDRLYMGYEVGSNLYFRRNDGAGWSNYLQLETGDLNNVYKWPTITQASDGQAWMVFEVNGQLYMRHYDGVAWGAKEYISPGSYANLKRGAGGDRVEWVSTICNGSPFDLTYSSLSLVPIPPPTGTPTPTSTPPPTSTPTSTPTAIADLIFADGFESGNLSRWSSTKTDSRDLNVSASAALVGSNGLQAVLDDNVAIYVTDDTPAAEPRYRARFYFDPNSIPMVGGNNHYIFYGYSGTSRVVMRVQFRFSNGNYQLRAALRNDASTWTNTSWFTINDAPHPIELDWQAATAAGANNGSLTLWIDGTQRANLTGVDNDMRRIDRVRLGAVTGIDSGTRGAYYFDAFESRRQTPIGP